MSASSDNKQPKAPAVNLSDAEWKGKLTDEQYRILRQKDTEHPGTGEYNKHFETGTYKCAGCGNELYGYVFEC
jgi:peptide-methionine (R)-S-oxide reductase